MAYAVTMSGKPLLEYAAAPPRSENAFAGPLIIMRRLVFATGVGFFAFGYGNTLIGQNLPEVPMQMGCGAFIAAVAMPWGWFGVRPRASRAGER